MALHYHKQACKIASYILSSCEERTDRQSRGQSDPQGLVMRSYQLFPHEKHCTTDAWVRHVQHTEVAGQQHIER